MKYLLNASTALTRPSAFASAPPVAPGYQPTPAQVQQVKEYQQRSNGGNTEDDVMLRRADDSAAMLEYWDKTDCLVEGYDAVVKAGQKYLPKFTDEEDSDFKFRLSMTKFTNVYRDIVESLAAKPFEQEVSLVEDAPDEIKAFIEDVDGSGNQITQFASLTFFNAINSSIDWIFVDYPPDDGTTKTVAQAKAEGKRPFWSHVLGRNVLEARAKVINGKETITYIRIFECGKPDHVRVFERAETGAVSWKLYVKTDTLHDIDGGKTRFIVEDEGVVTIGVIPLVPFATGRRDGRTFKYFPAMRDAADLQIELYQAESALKFARTLTAYPMLAGNGVNPPKNPDGSPKKLAVGPARVLYGGMNTAGHAGTWEYIEPGAASLTFLAADVKTTKEDLRELGRQPLTAQSGNLTVITASTAAGKAKSAVGAWALGLKDALENAMVITCLWKSIATESYSPQVNVYTEFDSFTEGKDLDTLTAARKNRDISHETYCFELKRRGVLSAEYDEDVEMSRLLDEVPADDGTGIDTLGGAPKPKIPPKNG